MFFRESHNSFMSYLLKFSGTWCLVSEGLCIEVTWTDEVEHSRCISDICSALGLVLIAENSCLKGSGSWNGQEPPQTPGHKFHGGDVSCVAWWNPRSDCWQWQPQEKRMRLLGTLGKVLSFMPYGNTNLD